MSKINPLSVLLNLLAKREYSEKEITLKTLKYEFNKIEFDEAIKYLKSKNFLNDQRFAYNIINFYFAQKGRNWIKNKSLSKGISEQDFEISWLKYEENEFDRDFEYNNLKTKIMQKYDIQDFENIPANILNKIFNYLAYRGFNPIEILEKWKNKDLN